MSHSRLAIFIEVGSIRYSVSPVSTASPKALVLLRVVMSQLSAAPASLLLSALRILNGYARHPRLQRQLSSFAKQRHRVEIFTGSISSTVVNRRCAFITV